MKKVLSFSAVLMLGLIASQILPSIFGANFETFRTVTDSLLYICLSFIMINVGREFELDKSKWRTYAADYFIAMATAAMPWLLIALYYVFVLLPPELWSVGDAWKENLLLSRFAAPTSAGILFTMLAAIGLQKSWIYKKIQVLAIFDDLDTILLMIPLQIAMIGMQWQMGVILVVVVMLLWIGWNKMSSYAFRSDWKSLLVYSALVYGATYVIYILTDHFFGEEGSVHIEVLLPAFVFGMVMKHGHSTTKADDRASTAISLLFMLLVGMSMPLIHLEEAPAQTNSVIASLPMLSWGSIALHVVLVSLLSNVGKLTPMLFYRDRSFKERLALSVGMFTRGEVGAGVIFIALGYHIGGPILLISVLTLVFNLILTGFFVVIVKRLALSCENK